MDSSHRVLFVDLLSPNCSTCLPTPPTPPAVDVSAPVEIQHKSTLLPGFLIAAGALLAVSSLLFLTFYSVLRRRRSRRQLATPADPHVGPPAAADEVEAPHHVWLIRTVGLDGSAIASIAAFAYDSGRGSGGDCTVCLGEFKDGEMVKLLPKCMHPFHASCVDTWLRSHVSCPLCRAPVIPEADQETDPDPENEMDVPSSSPSVVPVRRSVSMDAASLASLLEKADLSKKEIELGSVISGKGKEKVGCVVMKKSQSTRSGRFFIPRYGRGRSSSVLPL